MANKMDTVFMAREKKMLGEKWPTYENGYCRIKMNQTNF